MERVIPPSPLKINDDTHKIHNNPVFHLTKQRALAAIKQSTLSFPFKESFQEEVEAQICRFERIDQICKYEAQIQIPTSYKAD